MGKIFHQHSARGLRARAGVILAVTLLISALSESNAKATWSIVLVDTETKEIAVGSATCLTNFDLNQNLPVLLVDVGAACAQSAVDGGAINRNRIREQLLLGTDPEDIVEYLSTVDSAHESRQYGIVDTIGRPATFTGNQAGAHASGVTGQTGNIVYAIQGNVITGAVVVFAAEAAVINTPGDLPAKLMAAMEEARFYGGDGRCSCTVLAPTACGAPPPNFEKSAHIAFMVGSRTGDIDGVCNSGFGCANGDYFMDFNVPNQTVADPDPVLQLQDMFDQWRDAQVGAPDAVQSEVEVDKDYIRANFSDSANLVVSVKDWQSNQVIMPTSVTVEHAPDSAGASGIINITPLGNNLFNIEVGLAFLNGLDRFHVRVESDARSVIVLPIPELLVVAMEDIDADGETDLADYALMQNCILGPDHPVPAQCDDANFNFDLTVDLRDVGQFQREFTGEKCDILQINEQPERLDLCAGDSATLSVGVDADPSPTFQWFLNGAAIVGANAGTYALEDAQPDDEGYYTVEVSNSCGAVATEPVQVRVFDGECP
jgi:uncharacterized Ntn-hydrolase superfamily protein